jgi:UDP-N-acetylglucosamine 4,6-dehydratase/5-epimerase
MKNSVLLTTGGTGSFGNAVSERFLDSDISEIRFLSRDEKKQEDMRNHFNNVKLKFLSVIFGTIIPLRERQS